MGELKGEEEGRRRRETSPEKPRMLSKFPDAESVFSAGVLRLWQLEKFTSVGATAEKVTFQPMKEFYGEIITYQVDSI